MPFAFLTAKKSERSELNYIVNREVNSKTHSKIECHSMLVEGSAKRAHEKNKKRKSMRMNKKKASGFHATSEVDKIL